MPKTAYYLLLHIEKSLCALDVYIDDDYSRRTVQEREGEEKNKK